MLPLTMENVTYVIGNALPNIVLLISLALILKCRKTCLISSVAYILVALAIDCLWLVYPNEDFEILHWAIGIAWYLHLYVAYKRPLRKAIFTGMIVDMSTVLMMMITSVIVTVVHIINEGHSTMSLAASDVGDLPYTIIMFLLLIAVPFFCVPWLRKSKVWEHIPTWLYLLDCVGGSIYSTITTFSGLYKNDVTERYDGTMDKPMPIFLLLAFIGLKFAVTFLCIFFFEYRYRLKKRINQELQDKQQKVYFDDLTNSRDMFRTLRHDMRGYLVTLSQLLSDGKIDTATKYLGDVTGQVQKMDTIDRCNNLCVDAVLHNFLLIAKHKNVTLNIRAALPDDLPIASIDLTCIFYNLIDNALKHTHEGDEISICTTYVSGVLVVRVENSMYDTDVLPTNFERPQEIKKLHGNGLANVNETVKKNNGTFKLSCEGNKVIAQAVLMPEPQLAVQ